MFEWGRLLAAQHALLLQLQLALKQAPPSPPPPPPPPPVGGHWTYRHLTYDTVGVHRSDVCFR